MDRVRLQNLADMEQDTNVDNNETRCEGPSE